MATRKHSPGADVPSAASKTYDYVEAEVVEVLEGIGLAHVRTADGRIFGSNDNTAGIEFTALRGGVRVRCRVARKFNRVLSTELIF